MSRRETLSKAVADVLRQSLYDGVYHCGERLVEFTIAQEMNVSQNTARDALSVLEQEGWVTRRARHGVFVRSFTYDDVTELYMLRAALERLALGWGIDRLQVQYSLLKHDLDTAYMLVQIDNLYGAREMLFKLHSAIADNVNKPQTASILRRIHNQMRLLDNLRQQQLAQANMTTRHLSLYDTLLTHIHARSLTDAQLQLEEIIMRDGEALLKALNGVK